MTLALWQVPATWLWVHISELGEVISGGTPSTKEPAFWGEDVVWFAPSDLTGYKSKYIAKGAKSLSMKGLKNSSARIMPAGTVMFSSRAPIGYVAISRVEAATNQGFKSVVPSDAVFNEYLYFYLKASKQLAEDRATGTTFKEISGSAFSVLPVPLPPLPEQHRIVAKIEELFSELDASEESLTRARAQLGLYRQSLLKAAFQGTLTADWRAANPDKLETPEALLARIRREREAWYREEQEQWEIRCSEWSAAGRIGPRPARPDPYTQANPIAETELDTFPKLPSGWHYVRLNEVACIGSGVSVSKGRQLEDPVEVAYLRVANVQRGHLDLSVLKSMPVERSQVPSLALRPFDILFNEGGDRDKLGRGWIWEAAVAPCITQNHVFRGTLYHASAAAAKLVSYWGNSHGQDYFEKGGKQTTNLASINKTVLKALPVPVMSPEETRVLIDRLEAAMTDIAAAETEVATAIAKITALRQSILKKAFAGELVPQDPDDEPAADLLARIRAEALATGPKRKKNTVTKRTEKA